MAEGKKSFVAYSDWKNVFDELPNEDAGKLIKHIFAYVNDENPISDDVLIRAVFANIKATLKRDLNKWDAQLTQRKNAGLKSAEMRLTKSNDRSTTVETRQRNPTVSVNVNDNVIIKKERNISFNDSEIYDKVKFAESFPNWDKNKLKFWYESAEDYSAQGNKYVDWKAAIRSWERKDAKLNIKPQIKGQPPRGLC